LWTRNVYTEVQAPLVVGLGREVAALPPGDFPPRGDPFPLRMCQRRGQMTSLESTLSATCRIFYTLWGFRTLVFLAKGWRKWNRSTSTNTEVLWEIYLFIFIMTDTLLCHSYWYLKIQTYVVIKIKCCIMCIYTYKNFFHTRWQLAFLKYFNLKYMRFMIICNKGQSYHIQYVCRNCNEHKYTRSNDEHNTLINSSWDTPCFAKIAECITYFVLRRIQIICVP
jgi:hypothetical protein